MPKLRTILAWSIIWLSQVGLYLCYSANVGIRELVAAAIAAAVATCGAVVFARQAQIRLQLRWRDIVRVWPVPWYALAGTVKILQGLSQQVVRGDAPSVVRAVRFQMGGDDPASAGRRALAVFYTTMTPNFIVFGLFSRQKLLLYHQIIPGPVLTMTQKLGARP